MAASLLRGGADVSIVARGQHLAAIRAGGLRLKIGDCTDRFDIRATENSLELGPQDYVIVALKAHTVPAVVESIRPLLGPATAVVSAVNGIPWWYFYGSPSRTSLDGTWLETVDPGGVQWKCFRPERAIGCVVYPACDIPEPGLIRHRSGSRFTLGEPDGTESDRVRVLSQLMIAGGLKAPRKPNLRDEIWIKLWGNCSFNPVSALTGASLDVIGADFECRQLVRDIMVECKSVGEAVGARFAVTIDQRIRGGVEIVGHKPSTTHDVELGRTLEIDPLISSIQEIAGKLSISTPILDRTSALLKLKAEVLGLYRRPNRPAEAPISRQTDNDAPSRAHERTGHEHRAEI